jgi:hypothetical protein
MKTFFLAISFLLLFNLQSVAQADFRPRGSFKIEVGLPNNVTNSAFRDLMQGLAVFTTSYQFTFENTISLGAGLRYNYFNVNEFKNTVDLTGGLHSTGVFGKIGQEKFYGNLGVDYGLRAGYTFNFFDTNKNEEFNNGVYQEGALFLEPHLGLALMASENSSFRLALGYAFNSFQFRPNQVGLENFSGFSDEDLTPITTFFTIGFGYSYYFKN